MNRVARKSWRRGFDLLYNDESAKAEAPLLEALQECERTGDAEGIITVLQALDVLYEGLGKGQERENTLERILKVGESLGKHELIATACMELGDLHVSRNENKSAEGQYAKSARMFAEIGDTGGAALVQSRLGHSLLAQGFLEKAREAYENSLNGYLAISSDEDVAVVYLDLGNVQKELGDLDGALERYREAAIVFQNLGDQRESIVIELIKEIEHVIGVHRPSGR